jgi:S-adenosylmethionine:tRNA ribosyltransferase-isomerase
MLVPISARDISIADYTYDLPDDRIARHPAEQRDMARQLVYKDGKISEGIFRELAGRLPEGTLLIGNRTRVIHARMHFPLAEGKRSIEVFCLDPLAPVDYALSLGAKGHTKEGARTQVQWKCLIGGNRRWKRGPLHLNVDVDGQPVVLSIERGERMDNTFAISFSWEGGAEDLTFGEVLSAAGKIPLPPYLGRDTEAADHDRYQTVFAKTEGSVAAPTAGLHFTPEVMDSLAAKNIEWAEVTLHVGAGTFKPVDAETLGGHTMHREYFEVDINLVKRIARQLESGKPIVCVGTTSLRCIESLCYIARTDQKELDLSVGQWVTEEAEFSNRNALISINLLLKKMVESDINLITGYTGILLSPAAEIKVADGIVTNFHQPTSTLLLLIAAFVGEEWKTIYQYALDEGFRFLSYGDSSLLWKR